MPKSEPNRVAGRADAPAGSSVNAPRNRADAPADHVATQVDAKPNRTSEQADRVAGRAHAPADRVATQVQNVTVFYSGNPTTHQPALEDVTTELHYGSVKALIGPNGSGKSTLFKSIMGLIPLHTGSITHADDSPGAIAYVPQHEAVDWNFPISVAQVVASGRFATPADRGRLFGRKRTSTALSTGTPSHTPSAHRSIFGGKWLGRHTQTDRDAIEAALEIAHLTDLRDRQIGQLSGGQKKRVFVARGIAQGAHTLLLDEPFAGVDNTSRDDLTALFRQLAAEGKALLVATHDIDHLPTFCDEVVMINGRVIADGPTAVALTDENLLRAFSGVRGGVEGGKQ
ncbi:metal ABC transporter ATP-binding protein [Corynebacterium auriscanis]|uniref:metal ABC transporter ATP-binding protein n=1 Tax=Corynebacterium auriscanis TaxID=99807 RepID=UPI0024AD6D8D|nr:metal ABC transporter ATP-binding protein [Corynebacterium auriscanis]